MGSYIQNAWSTRSSQGAAPLAVHSQINITYMVYRVNLIVPWGGFRSRPARSTARVLRRSARTIAQYIGVVLTQQSAAGDAATGSRRRARRTAGRDTGPHRSVDAPGVRRSPGRAVAGSRSPAMARRRGRPEHLRRQRVDRRLEGLRGEPLLQPIDVVGSLRPARSHCWSLCTVTAIQSSSSRAPVEVLDRPAKPRLPRRHNVFPKTSDSIAWIAVAFNTVSIIGSSTS